MGNKSVILQLHPETLRWIREEAQADMADASVIQLLNDWELGTKKPTLSQVQNCLMRHIFPLAIFS